MLKKISLLALLLAGSSVIAADNSQNIAVVNSEKVRTDTKAGQSIMQQLESLQKSFQEKVNKFSKDFENKKQDLDKQKTVLSKEAFTKKEAEFNTQLAEARKQLQQEGQKLQQMEQNALVDLNNVARQAIDEIVKAGKYSHILPNEVFIHADPKSDITSQVVAAVDKKTDKIQLKDPGTQAHPAVNK